MNTPATPDWEKTFDSAFSEWKIRPIVSQIKELFRTLLSDQRRELAGKIERIRGILHKNMLEHSDVESFVVRNDAKIEILQSVLALLKDPK